MLMSNTIGIIISILGMIGFFVLFGDFLYELFTKHSINNTTKTMLTTFISQKKYIKELYVESGPAHEELRFSVGNRKWKHRLVRLVNKFIKEIPYSSPGWTGTNYKKYRCLWINASINRIKEKIQILQDLTTASQTFSGENLNIDGKDCDAVLTIIEFVFKPALKSLETIAQLVGAKTILLTASAGNGKTFLFCSIAEMLQKQHRTCLLINSRDMGSKPRAYLYTCLCGEILVEKVILRKLYIRMISGLAYFKHKPIVIMIDAINENDNQEFRDELAIMVMEFQAFKGIKVLLSCRSEYLEARFSELLLQLTITKTKNNYDKDIFIGNGDSYFLRYGRNFHNNNDLLFQRYKTYMNFTGNISPNVIERLNSCSFLTFRIFFETFRDSSESVRTFNRAEIFSKYIGKVSKKNEDVATLLYEVSAYMIKNKSYYSIPESSVKNVKGDLSELLDDNILLAQTIDSHQPDDIRSEPQNIITFTFDELRDYQLAKYLIKESPLQNYQSVFNVLDDLKNDGNHRNGYDFITSPYEGVLSFAYLHFFKQKNYEECRRILYEYIGVQTMLNRLLGDNSKQYLGIQLIFDCGIPKEDFEVKYVQDMLRNINPGIFQQVFSFYIQEQEIEKLLSLILPLKLEDLIHIFADFFYYEHDLKSGKAVQTDETERKVETMSELFLSSHEKDYLYFFLFLVWCVGVIDESQMLLSTNGYQLDRYIFNSIIERVKDSSLREKFYAKKNQLEERL